MPSSQAGRDPTGFGHLLDPCLLFLRLATAFGSLRVGSQQGTVQRGAKLARGLGRRAADQAFFNGPSKLRVLAVQAGHEYQGLRHVDLPGRQSGSDRG